LHGQSEARFFIIRPNVRFVRPFQLVRMVWLSMKLDYLVRWDLCSNVVIDGARSLMTKVFGVLSNISSRAIVNLSMGGVRLFVCSSMNLVAAWGNLLIFYCKDLRNEGVSISSLEVAKRKVLPLIRI
jgi:hypothetical protein